MDCIECQALIQRAADDEAAVAEQSALREHLRICADCSRESANLQTLRAALRSPALRFAAPPELRQRVAAAARPARRSWLIRGLAAAVLLLAGAGLSFAYFSAQSQRDTMVRDVASAHIRALMPNHLIDVTSTDSHTVKPWFAGKLDFSPQVFTFPEQKFDLTGGRLDYVARRPVAALVYQRRQHIIDVFTWPQDGADELHASAPIMVQGYNIISWRQNGMAYWMVSELNAKEMDELKELIQNRVSAH